MFNRDLNIGTFVLGGQERLFIGDHVFNKRQEFYLGDLESSIILPFDGDG